MARSLVDLALSEARDLGATAIRFVTLEIGPLSGVDPAALQFCFPEAAADSILEGAELKIVHVPLVVWCSYCLCEVSPAHVSHLVCPRCGTAAGEIRRGRELHIIALEVETPEVLA